MTKPILALLLLILQNSSVMFVNSFSRIARCAPSVRRASSAVPFAPRTGSAPSPSLAPSSSLLAPSSSSSGRMWMSSPAGGSPEQASVVDTCRDKIAAALETDDVKVLGAYDDPNGSHISIEVYSELFEGKRPVQRQQLVYKALWEELQGAVHAVDSMVCKTPAEKK